MAMDMAAGRLPRFVVIQTDDGTEDRVYYDELSGARLSRYVSVFSTEVKIEVEPAKTAGSSFVHLRFCAVNRYLGRSPDGLVVAETKQPEEDTSKPSCTLFYPTFLNDHNGTFYLTHVQSEGSAYTDGVFLKLDVNDHATPLRYVNWETLVKMPGRVSIKGDNGKYLSAYWFQELPYLGFSSDDPNDESSGFEIQLHVDGYVYIKSLHFGKLWRYAVNWIWADSDDGDDVLFWRVKIDDKTIALRAANNNFCKGLSVDAKEDCLNAAVSTITREARLTVEELVLHRKISNVRYRMEDARIFDEKPFMVGTTTKINRADQDGSISVEMEFEDQMTYSFNRSFSLTAGVTSSIEGQVLGIVNASIEVSFGVSGSFEWGKSKLDKKRVKVTGTVPVRARSKAIVNCVGTMGTCNVPFSYVQQDRMSTDGRIVETEYDDGMFTGVNRYNFNFEVLKEQPL